MAYSSSAFVLPFQARYQAQSTPSESTQHQVGIEELLTAEFIARQTQFKSIGAFFNASGLEPQSLVSLDGRTRSRWDTFVRTVSKFPDWEAMLRRARGEWMLRRMGIAIGA